MVSYLDVELDTGVFNEAEDVNELRNISGIGRDSRTVHLRVRGRSSFLPCCLWASSVPPWCMILGITLFYYRDLSNSILGKCCEEVRE